MAKNTFALFGILTVLLLGLGLTSATTSSVLEISNLSFPTSVAENAGSFTFTFNIKYTGTSPDVIISFDDSTSTIGSVSIPDTPEMNEDDVVTVTGTVSGFANRGGDNLTVRINATRGSSRDDETSFTVAITDVSSSDYNFCEVAGEVGDLKFSDISFNNLGEGEDDDWYLLDNIEIEVEVENTNKDDNVKNVVVEIMILDDRDNDVTKDFDFADEKIDLNTIKDDDSEVAIFKISELPADLESGNYKVYIKAYSEDEEDLHCTAKSRDLNEEYYQKIDITREDDPAVIVKEDPLLTISASCGEQNIQLPLSIYNLGSEKEDKILVTLQNGQLGLNEKIIIDDLRSGKRKDIMFTFDLPKDLTKEMYTLDIITYYDYDKDEDQMQESSYGENSNDDLDKDFSVRLQVLSCRGPSPTINANLESEAKVGQDIVIKTLITNNGGNNDFVISASDFESWATLKSISPATASINEGEYEEITLVLTPTESGAQSFKINTIIDGETYSQLVSVNIEGKSSIFSGISGVDDTILYIVAGIIILIILIIIVLLVRIARK